MKKSQLVEIIKEEIKSVLQEMELYDFLKEEFPMLIDYDKKRRGSEIEWTISSHEKIDKGTISDFQEKAGYSPAGYGGPYKIKETEMPDGTFKYEWISGATS